MRTTLNTIFARVQTNLNNTTLDIERINSQISSGSQLSKISDNPVNLASALNYRSSIVELEQYQENIQHGDTVITASEQALVEMKDLVSRSKVLAIQATDPAVGPNQHLAIAAEIANIFEETILLGNTQINGQYIFGGHRTTGYTELEPAPFVVDKGNGYWINGSIMTPMSGYPLTGTIPIDAAGGLADITAGDLLINDVDIAAGGPIVLLPGGDINGLNMAGADTLVNAINAPATVAQTNVTASLTTLVAGANANDEAVDGNDAVFSFTLNGQNIDVTINDGDLAADVAQTVVTLINAQQDATGVKAQIGDGANGGVANSIVLTNVTPGDDSAITIENLSGAAQALTGMTNNGPAGQAAGPANNTGEISFSSAASFTLTSQNYSDDTMLDVFGLGGGGVGFIDDANDGTLIAGYRLNSGDLTINGIDVPATSDDGLSDIYADASAAAKATAINSISGQTGVTAEIVPATVSASGAIAGGTETSRLTGLVTNNAIAAGDLAINGTAIGVINGGASPNGLNMTKADNAKTAINALAGTTGVTAHLTTLTAGGPAGATGTADISFDLNGISVSVTTGNVSPTQTASALQAAINKVAAQTGVRAEIGTGTNGGPVNALVLKNTIGGDESAILIENLIDPNGDSGLANNGPYGQSADAAHNTGEISFESQNSFTLSSPNTVPATDAILVELGLKSATGDGTATSGTGELDYGATPNYLDSGDLIINGVDIFSVPTAILAGDRDNTLVAAINAKVPGVNATRDASGALVLSAADGRNIHVQTSLNGESTTNLNGGSQDQIYFGTIQLVSDRKFSLESPTGALPNQYEIGFATLGMAGGASSNGEPGDVAGDGKIDVHSIHNQTGTVRYTGDRENNLEVKISKTTKMIVGENGKSAIADTGLYSSLKEFEDALRGQNFTTVTGIHSAFDLTATLDSKNTGLEPDTLLPDEALFSSGTFTVYVTDHEYSPARTTEMTLSVDPAVDTLASVTERINGIPHISASWTSDGNLLVESDDPDRYTFSMENDTSNFLEATGTSFRFMQAEAFQRSIAAFDGVMDDISEQISDFGARANRITVQSNIYTNILLTRRENLSEVQDTDMIKAIMELKAKEVAYQAALNAAAKTMQLSLVDFL